MVGILNFFLTGASLVKLIKYLFKHSPVIFLMSAFISSSAIIDDNLSIYFVQYFDCPKFI